MWWVAVALGVLVAGATVASRTRFHELVYTPAVVALAVAFAVVVRRRALQPVRAWTTFAVGLVLLALGDVVYSLPWTAELGRTQLSAADLLYVVGSVALVVGALRIKGAHVGERDREALFDAACIGLAAAVLLWRPLIQPRFDMAATTLASRMVTGSYPVFDVIVMAMLVWMLLSSRRWTASLVLMVGGSAFYLAADLAYTARLERGTVDDPNLAWLDVLWLVAYALYLLAVLHPSAVAMEPAGEVDRTGISTGRLVLSGATLLAPMVALAVSGTDSAHLVAAAVVEAVVVLLVMLRLRDLAAGERRARLRLVERERYFRSLVRNAAEAMVVLDAEGLVTDASPAARPLLGLSPHDLVGRRPAAVVQGLDCPAFEAVVAASMEAPGVVITGEVLVATAGTVRWLEVRTTNLTHDPAVGGVVVNLHDVTARHQVQADLERRAFSDSLTGLPNRALFHDRLDQLAGRRVAPDVAVIYCDLDRFKSVNDRFGHDEGDALLRITADRLAAAVRAEDTVARLGGDEFAVIVEGADALLQAAEIARRIVEGVRRPLRVGTETVPVSVSVGVAAVRGMDPTRAHDLLSHADAAMYRAKRAGGDRVVVYDDQAEAPLLEPSTVAEG